MKKFLLFSIIIISFSSCYRYYLPTNSYPNFYKEGNQYVLENDLNKLPNDFKLSYIFGKLQVFVLDSVKYRIRNHLNFLDVKSRYTKIQKQRIKEFSSNNYVYIINSEPNKIFYYPKEDIFSDFTNSKTFTLVEKNLGIRRELSDLKIQNIELKESIKEDSIKIEKTNLEILEKQFKRTQISAQLDYVKSRITDLKNQVHYLETREVQANNSLQKYGAKFNLSNNYNLQINNTLSNSVKFSESSNNKINTNNNVEFPIKSITNYNINSGNIKIPYDSKCSNSRIDPYKNLYKDKLKTRDLVDLSSKPYDSPNTSKNGYNYVHPIVEKKLDILNKYLSNPELLKNTGFSKDEIFRIKSWNKNKKSNFRLVSATRNSYHQISMKENNPSAGSPLNSLHTFGGAVDLSSENGGNYAYAHRKAVKVIDNEGNVKWKSQLKSDYRDYIIFKKVAEKAGFYFIVNIPKNNAKQKEIDHFRREGLHIVPTEFRNENYKLTPLALRLLTNIVYEIEEITQKESECLEYDKSISLNLKNTLLNKNKYIKNRLKSRGELLKNVTATFEELNNNYVLSKKEIVKSEKAVLNLRNNISEMEKKLEDVRHNYFSNKFEMERIKNEHQINFLKSDFAEYKRQIDENFRNLTSILNRLERELQLLKNHSHAPPPPPPSLH